MASTLVVPNPFNTQQFYGDLNQFIQEVKLQF